MYLLVCLVACVQSYSETLENKIFQKHNADASKAGVRVIMMTYSDLVEVYYNASDTWAVLLYDPSHQKSRIANTSWNLSAKELHEKRYSYLLGKVNLSLYDNTTDFLNLTKQQSIVFFDDGYFYVYTGKIMVGEVMDLLVNRTYKYLEYYYIPGWNGESFFKKIIRHAFYSLTGLAFLFGVVFSLYKKYHIQKPLKFN